MLLILSLTISVHAQIIEFQCLILNSETLEPVPYATLGILNENIGTNADALGQISFRINEQLLNSSSLWLLSSVGFEPKKLLHQKLRRFDKDTILLTPATQILDEITLNRKELKPKSVGKKSHGALTHVNIYSINDSIDDGLSQEYGIIVKLRSRCLIDDFNIYISSNNFEQMKLQFLAYSIMGDSVTFVPHPEPVYFNVNEHGWASVV